MISSIPMRSDLGALMELLGGGQAAAGGQAESDGGGFVELLQGMLEAGVGPEEVAAMLQAAGDGKPAAGAPGGAVSGEEVAALLQAALHAKSAAGMAGEPAPGQRGLPSAQAEPSAAAGEALELGRNQPQSAEALFTAAGAEQRPGARPAAGGSELQALLSPLQAALAKQQAAAGEALVAPQPMAVRAGEGGAHEGLWAQLRAFGPGAAPVAGANEATIATDILRAEALGRFAARSQALDEQAVANLQARLSQLQGQVQSQLQVQGQTQGEAAAAKAEPALMGSEPQAQLNPANARPAVPGAVPTYTLPTPAGQPGWGQAMGERLSWLVRNGVQQAQIRLDPPSLGPVQIAIVLKDDQTNVQINAQTPQAREALESELPRLRQMLEEGGFAGVDVGVSQRQAGDGGNGRDPFAALLNGEGDEEADAQAVALERPLEERGLVDQYA